MDSYVSEIKINIKEVVGGFQAYGDLQYFEDGNQKNGVMSGEICSNEKDAENSLNEKYRYFIHVGAAQDIEPGILRFVYNKTLLD